MRAMSVSHSTVKPHATFKLQQQAKRRRLVSRPFLGRLGRRHLKRIMVTIGLGREDEKSCTRGCRIIEKARRSWKTKRQKCDSGCAEHCKRVYRFEDLYTSKFSAY